MIFVPSAFDVTSGEMHWDLIHRTRAMDNQVYVAVISPARNHTVDYVCYGHSMVIDPYARILQEAGTEEEIVYSEIGMKFAYGF